VGSGIQSPDGGWAKLLHTVPAAGTGWGESPRDGVGPRVRLSQPRCTIQPFPLGWAKGTDFRGVVVSTSVGTAIGYGTRR